MYRIDVRLFSLFIVWAPVLSGCNTLKQMFEGAHSDPPEETVFPSNVQLEGTTQFDYQLIENFPSSDRFVQAEVMRPGESEFSELNAYEFSLDSARNTLAFKKEVNIFGQTLIVTGLPAAPKGSRYKLTSTSQAGPLLFP